MNARALWRCQPVASVISVRVAPGRLGHEGKYLGLRVPFGGLVVLALAGTFQGLGGRLCRGAARPFRLMPQGLLSSLCDEGLRRITPASLHFEIDPVRRHFSCVIQIDTAAKLQVNREGDIVTVDLGVLDRLFKLIASHRASKLSIIRLQFESYMVGIAVAARLVSSPGSSGIGSQQKSQAG